LNPAENNYSEKGRQMKNTIGIGIIILFLFCAWSLFAGSVDHNNNFSAGYVRTFNRNAVTDAPDAAVYNPAGTVKLDDGLYVSAHNQSVFKNYSHESSLSSEKYAAKNPTFFLPSAFVVYSSGSWAAFGAFTVPGGGGRLKYDDGIADLNEALLLDPYGPTGDLFAAYYALTFGYAYKINDIFSFSLGGRYVSTVSKWKFENETTPPVGFAPYNVKTLLETKATSSGDCLILGMNITPVSGLNIGIRYETPTNLEWEYKKVDGPLATLAPPNGLGLAEGDTYDRDLPALLGIGMSCQVLPKLRAESSFMYYFNTKADWDGDEDDHDNGFEVGASAEYSVLSNLRASLGFLYTDQGADPDSYVYLNPSLKAFTVCGGGMYGFSEDFSIELGIAGIFYSEDDGESLLAGLPVKLDKTAFNVSVGAQYKVF
jgi:long-chain fatty acid transport protein